MYKLFVFMCVFFLTSCSGYSVGDGELWLRENYGVANEIVLVSMKSTGIERVDLDGGGVGASDDYINLQRMARKIGVDSIEISRSKVGSGFNGSIRLAIKSSGISTDGCLLAVSYINDGQRLDSLGAYAAVIKKIPEFDNWYVVIYGDKYNCTQ